MNGLELRVRLCDLRPWFAQPEAELTEESLALSHFQLHPEFAPQERGERRTIPHLSGQAKLRRAGAQRSFHLRQVGLA